MEPSIVLDLSHGRDNPRNSEGSFVTLTDGRILFAYSRYYGESWGDEAAARIASRVSADGGHTWSDQDELVVENEGRCESMAFSVADRVVDVLKLHRLAKTLLAVSGAPTEMTFEPRLFHQVLVVLRIIHVIAVRHEVAQVLGVLIALTDGVMLRMLVSHFQGPSCARVCPTAAPTTIVGSNALRRSSPPS